MKHVQKIYKNSLFQFFDCNLPKEATTSVKILTKSEILHKKNRSSYCCKNQCCVEKRREEAMGSRLLQKPL